MQTYQEFSDLSQPDAPVRGDLYPAQAPGADCLILTHGAGANCRSSLLMALADAFCAAGMTVLRCDLPFRQARPHGPPIRSAERDQAGLQAAVMTMRQMGVGRVYLGGHSYGGRQASILAAREPELTDALLLLSYPLHPPKKPEQLRTQHLPALQIPAMFVHGVRDELGSIAEMESALALIPARTELLPVEAAGHELLTRSNCEKLIEQVTSKFRAFTRMPA